MEPHSAGLSPLRRNSIQRFRRASDATSDGSDRSDRDEPNPIGNPDHESAVQMGSPSAITIEASGHTPAQQAEYKTAVLLPAYPSLRTTLAIQEAPI